MQTAQEIVDHYKAVRARLTAPRVIVKVQQSARHYTIMVAPPRARVEKLYEYPIGPCRPILSDLMLTAENSCKPGSVAYANKVLAEVSEKHGVRVVDILSLRRFVSLIPPRREACWRLKHETPWSLPRIGRFLGGRDHTTALASIRKHQEMLDGLQP